MVRLGACLPNACGRVAAITIEDDAAATATGVITELTFDLGI